MNQRSLSAHHHELDRKLVAAAQGIHVLGRLTWPEHLHQEFLSRWQRGKAQLPNPTYAPVDYTAQITELDAIAAALRDDTSSVGSFLRDTALSYSNAARMLECAGTEKAAELGYTVYGPPGNALTGSTTTSIDAANYFIDVSQAYARAHGVGEEAYCLPAQYVADAMQMRIKECIPEGLIRVVVDKNMPSKAAAGATRVRLRDATCFSEFDLEQLLQHEVFVHSLTALNGRAQPQLTALSLAAPRTTATQEGLATFAELVTGAIDINRMERIALRIKAIQAALNGADFIDVFRLFLDQGQVETESYNSALRVFRGVPLTGGHAFTKDAVYLRGLIEVHTFFRWALKNDRIDLLKLLFVGRLALSDLLRFERDHAAAQVISPPLYLPPWMSKTNGLTAYLAFSVFAGNISLEGLSRVHFEDLPAGEHRNQPGAG